VVVFFFYKNLGSAFIAIIAKIISFSSAEKNEYVTFMRRLAVLFTTAAFLAKGIGFIRN
jgi:hypothetical protein